MTRTILEQPVVKLAAKSQVMPDHSSDWHLPAAPPAGDARPRIARPKFIYRGHGDAHWRGQACDLIGSRAAEPEHRMVIMACGCQASVPWWTLDPMPAANSI